MIGNTVAIVGGGIGGLASAILLANKGYRVTIYEQAKKPAPVGAGFLLQPPGQWVLDQLGVLADISGKSVPIHGLHSKTNSGRELLKLEYSQLKGKARHGLGVQRRTIYEALLKCATELNNVTIRWNSRIEKLSHSHESLHVQNKGAEKRYDLCILSSGSNSELANEYFEKRIKRPYGWGCLWTTIDLPETLSPNTLHQRCQGATKMMGILPVFKSPSNKNGYQAALYWSMKNSDIDRFDESEFEQVKQEIIAFWPETKSAIEPLSYPHFVSAKYNDIWTPKPYKGRLVAIGDVSHATSPQLGQGCTMALLDAWSLAQHLPAALEMVDNPATPQNITPSQNVDDVFGQWWKSRRYQLAYVRHLSKFLTPLFQSESKSCELFRDWIMAPTGKLPIFDSLQLKTLASEVLLKNIKGGN